MIRDRERELQTRPDQRFHCALHNDSLAMAVIVLTIQYHVDFIIIDAAPTCGIVSQAAFTAVNEI
ncbi:MAG: hypothetical protein Tsb002_35170 [Wenzhouxiangellaceae bacterium]